MGKVPGCDHSLRYGHPQLGLHERVLTWVAWLMVAIGLILYSVSLSSGLLHKMNPAFFSTGWEFFSGYKDSSDFEWTFWKTFLPVIVPACLVYSMGGHYISLHQPRYRQLYYVLCSAFILCYILTWKGLALVLAFSVILYASLILQSLAILWTVVTIQLLFLHYFPLRMWMLSSISEDGNCRDLVYFSLMMCSLKLISFGGDFLNYHKTRHQSATVLTALDMLHYILYLPLFFNGPLLVFNKFHEQFLIGRKNPGYKFSFGAIKEVCSCLLIGFGLEIFLHYSYVPAISKHTFLLEELDCLSIISVAWVQINLFCAKYKVLYGAARLLAKLDDFEVPGPPKCVATVYTFEEMWRTFDKGLYEFLHRYIYLPVGGSNRGLSRRLFGSFLCFMFVGFWHGGTLTLFVWAATNWIGIVLGVLVKIFLNSSAGMNMKIAMGCTWYRRLCALSGSAAVILLISSNFIFLAGVESTFICLRRLFISGGYLFPLLILVGLYFGVECIIDIS